MWLFHHLCSGWTDIEFEQTAQVGTNGIIKRHVCHNRSQYLNSQWQKLDFYFKTKIWSHYSPITLCICLLVLLIFYFYFLFICLYFLPGYRCLMTRTADLCPVWHLVQTQPMLLEWNILELHGHRVRFHQYDSLIL